MISFFCANIFAQQAHEVVGQANKVIIYDFENTYSSLIDKDELVITYYINNKENQNNYFYVTLSKQDALAQRIIQGVRAYKENNTDMATHFFEQEDIKKATAVQQHQLKRDKVLVCFKDSDKIVVVSYSPEYYKQHVQNQ